MTTVTTDRRRTARHRAFTRFAALGAAALVATTAACAGTDPARSGTDFGTASAGHSGTTTVAAPAGYSGTTAVAAPTEHSGTTAIGASGDASAENAGGRELTADDVNAWLEEKLPAALEDNAIAGASVAVVHDGEVLTARGFGSADTGADGGGAVEADGDTLFRPGSVSKVFTATAVMQLVEQGELDLDADVSEYLDFELSRDFAADITLRHLLTHTAGFEERIRGMIGKGDEPVNLREVLANDPPQQVYAPGTTPSYSNYSNALAGYIVQRVSGEQFEDYVDQHIFEPLGMDSSTFHQPLPDELASRMSQGYVDASGAGQPFEMVSEIPAGALSSSAQDMARFMLALVGPAASDTGAASDAASSSNTDAPSDTGAHSGTVAPADEPLLSDETRDLMFSPGLSAAELGSFADAPQMTLGFFEADRNGQRIVGHGGDTHYFHSNMELHLDTGAGFYISLNSGGTDPLVTNQLRTDMAAKFTDRYFPGPNASAGDADAQDADAQDAVGQEIDAATMEANAKQLAGRYSSSRGFHSTFLAALDPFMGATFSATDDGRLQLNPDPATQRPAVYEQVSKHVWQEVDGTRQMAVRTQDGEVTGIVYENAFTLLPLDADRRAGPWMLGTATVVLLVVLLAWPIGAIWRWLRLRRVPAADRPVPTRADRWVVLMRVGMVATLVAVAGWVGIVASIIGGTDVAPLLIRSVQALQVVGALGMIPAAVRLVGVIRQRAGWRPITTSALTLAALSMVMNFAIMFELFAPSISY